MENCIFKLKYLSMPTMTNADALLVAAKNIGTGLSKEAVQILEMTKAVKNIMDIFKQNP